MLSDLVWLFPAHRQLHAEVVALRQVVADLERQIAVSPANPTDLIRRYTDEVLSEQPFTDGKIPDELWLTPVDDRY